MRARERGAVVTLLDEGGIDDLDEPTSGPGARRVSPTRSRRSSADRIIVRTVAEGRSPSR